MKYKIKNILLVFFKGGAIGIANLIPGISGGTIAVVVGIYNELIESISKLANFKRIEKRSFIFLITLFLGAGVFIFLSAGLINYLIYNHFGILMFCFLGIILGSIPRIVRIHEDMKITFSRLIMLVFGIALPVLIYIYTQNRSFELQGLTNNTFNYFVLILSGVLSGGAMLIPGISGALILVLLGQYINVVFYVRQLVFKPLVVFILGAVLGVIIFAKLINIFLNRYPSLTLYFILGLVLGASYKLYPGTPINAKVLFLSIFFFLIFFAISIVLGSAKFQKGGK